jgi:predicted GNAT family N-acyltransferase
LTYQTKQPETDEEFKHYFDLRWRILRAPWNQPRGSEIDDIEDDCFHIMVSDGENIIGIGRLQFNSASEAQIRYMAVEPEYEKKGIGKLIVNALESHALKNNSEVIVLDAREPAVGFYKKLGYEILEKSYLLFGSVQHWRMRKTLR